MSTVFFSVSPPSPSFPPQFHFKSFKHLSPLKTTLKRPLLSTTTRSSLHVDPLESDPPLPPSVRTFWKWLAEEGVVSSTCPVPRRLWINPDTVAASEIGYRCADLKPWVAVYLFLIREKMRGNLPWRFYIDILPERTDSTLYWSEEELAEIKGTLLLRMTREMKEHVESQHHKVKEEIMSRHEQQFPSSITLDGFLWAFIMPKSRALSHLRGQLVMLPLVDLINHSASITREDNAEEINGPAGLFSWDLLFCLKSTMPVKEGEQVVIQYGLKKSNADLAFYYGFVEPNTNRDSYTLTFNISELDPFHREKLDIAAANDLGETAYFDIFMDRPLPPAILPYLRLVALQEADAFLLEPVYRKSIWKTLELPVSHVNEELVCKMVIDACESALSGYRTTVEQDEKLIQEGNLGYKLEIAVTVRVGEKRVLQQIEGIVKEKEAQLDKLEYYHERRLKELGLVGEEDETYCQPKKDSIPTL
ncbi:hypothetical protein ACJRO7_010226 [Eucalyptus globulus]|uniref:Rubisco LSMT substrate-binding domain-containing protein n=1 Tax=Eucalyptus globulus TaxID=34317 RepID=A0ABD3LG50_EUCGL